MNKVILIGNLTKDPELRYTPQGTPVATFGVATNRQWTTEEGEKKEETEFHNIVCWNRLAEICAEYLKKGRQVYVEGRLSTREWEGQDGQKRRTTEVIANEVIFLGSGAPTAEVDAAASGEDFVDLPEDLEASLAESEEKEDTGSEKKDNQKTEGAQKEKASASSQQNDSDDDIPF